MQRLELKPTHKPVQNYYAALRQFDDLGVTHETAVRSAFQGLLDHCARQHDWTLVPEWEIRRPRQHPLRVDGALLDNFRLTHGFWEAKDILDDLPKEVRKKFDLGYYIATYNDFLTLDGIPPEAFGYRLGNRSALEWVIDQYQVSTDKRSGITNDPNRPDDPDYIVRLLGHVITVSLETVRVIKHLSPLER